MPMLLGGPAANAATALGGEGGRHASKDVGGRLGLDTVTPSFTTTSTSLRSRSTGTGVSTLLDDLKGSGSTSPASQQQPTLNLNPLLINTASAARWRRRGDSAAGNSGASNVNKQHYRERDNRKRDSKDLVLKVAAMEEVHGVDVSWLHRPNKEHHHHHKHTSHKLGEKRDAPPPTPTTNDTAPTREPPKLPSDLGKVSSPPIITPQTPVQPSQDFTSALPALPTSSSTTKSQPKRPGLLGRASAEKVSGDGKGGSRRQSWMNSLSSKFSSQSPPERPGATPTSAQKAQQQLSLLTPNSANEVAVEEAEQSSPSKPRESSSSFFSSLTRKLSTASQVGGIPKVQGTGGVCARRVLNVDPNRERCLVPEMDPNRLRKVSFCVDVEIAGGPRYREEEDDEHERKRKKKEFKMKERAEGEALKNPEALKEEKDEEGEPKLESKSKAVPNPWKEFGEKGDQDENAAPGEERDSAARKKEKKKKSEEERKERKEKRRKRAEENGQIPVELALDGEGDDATAGSSQSGTPAQSQNDLTAAAAASTPKFPEPSTPPPPQSNNAHQARPTTDPVRIYRRCCQLRESPILKRITEQLMSPKCCLPAEPGVVNLLDLTGSRLQLADVISLSDWLAVVPVKHLKLEDADLNDEGVRCILAGLLAAKKPEVAKRRSITPRHRDGLPEQHYRERAGVIEKITLKNNPRISRVGWKHISLFIYMCRSLRAIDVSMNQFPDTLPPSAHVTPIKSPSNAPRGDGQEIDASEALYKCLSERFGGSKLEELILSECGLGPTQVRKVVDGAIMCGISRLGLAGNRLEDEESLEHVLRYLRSGICQALDIGGNDLRGKLGLLADAIKDNANDSPCWGLSLADCNLDSASLKPLFSALVKLPNFRFIDLSHNRDLCSVDSGLVGLLRRYMAQFKELKRIHLTDVGMSPKKAIALADVLPEAPRLAHLNLLENPQLTALANARTEADQEEACALYASLMAAVRVSSTLICVDIDVPSPDNSEVVKALAKQVVAYSLRNMEQFAIAEATGNAIPTANATAALTGPHGGEKGVKDINVPDVLMHIVGHVEGSSENHDNDGPAPDEDYIVGGTGVVKALQYVLGEKADDSRRTSYSQPPSSGAVTPKERPGSSAGLVEAGKAKKMSKNLLGSARKIRDRLQPALVKEATAGDELAYRRLLFLDQTLHSMILRFEEEYPETRIAPPASPLKPASEASSSLTDHSNLLASSVNTQATETSATAGSDEDEFDDEDVHIKPRAPSRQHSDVNLASRAQTMEEGRLHRIGQQLRRDVLNSPNSSVTGKDAAVAAFEQQHQAQAHEQDRLRAVGERIESISGLELKELVNREGWDQVLQKAGGNYDDLRRLQEEDPEAWDRFMEAEMKKRLNADRERPGSAGFITSPPNAGA